MREPAADDAGSDCDSDPGDPGSACGQCEREANVI